MNKYYNTDDVNSMFGIKIPWALVQDKVFKEISPTGKLLYGVISDLIEIAEMNNLRDKDGKSYVNFNLKYLADIFDMSEDEMNKYVSELTDVDGKGNGLILIKQVDDQNRIYMYRFSDIYKFLKGK